MIINHLFVPLKEEELVFDHNDQMQYHIRLKKKIEEQKKVNQLSLKRLL
jgi:hypothetical protein